MLFIIGLVSSVLLLRTGGFTHTKDLDYFARELNSYFKVIQQQAILQSAVLGVAFTNDSYEVFQLLETRNRWYPLREVSKFWRIRPIPYSIQIGLKSDNRALPIAKTGRGAKPQLVFMPSGEVTPFSLTLQQAGNPYIVQLYGTFAGDLEIKQLK